MTISISLEQYGDRGWEWTVTGVDICGDTVREHCRTNRQGEGLWNVGSYEDKQIVGTCQFGLPANRKAAYAKIRREFMRDHGLLREQW